MAVATLTDVKTHLNIVSTASDSELTSFLAFAVDAAERWTGRVLGDAAAATETYDGGVAMIPLDRVPVTTVSTARVHTSPRGPISCPCYGEKAPSFMSPTSCRAIVSACSGVVKQVPSQAYRLF